MDKKILIKYKYELIRQINQYRNNHGVRSLKSDFQMDKEAQLSADQLSGGGGESRYKTESPNETIYLSGLKISAEDLAKVLYNENAWYDFQSENPKPSNFTRMVWKNSELIGFGMKKDQKHQFIFVIKYFPIGNKNGEFQDNVFPYNTKYSQSYLKKRNDNKKRASYSTKKQNQNKDIDNQKRYDYNIVNQNENKNIFNAFCIEALNAHNYYRRIHHVEPLVLNSKLCRIAETYSRNLAYSIGALNHSNNTYEGKNIGENLYSCTGKEATGEMATNSWYREIKDYDYSGNFSVETGHFTQLVWRSTKEVGFGKTIDKNGKSFVVANYFPCGNTPGTFDFNVLRP